MRSIVDWQLLILIGASLGVASAMSSSGLAAGISRGILGAGVPTPGAPGLLCFSCFFFVFFFCFFLCSFCCLFFALVFVFFWAPGRSGSFTAPRRIQRKPKRLPWVRGEEKMVRTPGPKVFGWVLYRTKAKECSGNLLASFGP